MTFRNSWRTYLKRARLIGISEFIHRGIRVFTYLRLRVEYHAANRISKSPREVEDLSFCNSAEPQLESLDWAMPQSDSEFVSRVLAGYWPALGYSWQWQAATECWRVAPDTGRKWPKKFFGAIPYAGKNAYGDIRVAWEPSRLQQLVALGLISNGSDSAQSIRAIRLLEDQLHSWVKSNPHLEGIHYISAMECAQRIIACCHALDMVRGQLISFRESWSALICIVESHARLIESRLSLYSSSGNHTIAEATGLIYAGVLFPELQRAARWRRRGLQLLRCEADRQVLPDGGGLEQSFHYHLFVIDLIGLAISLLEHKEGSAPSDLKDIFERGKEFLQQFADKPSELPTFGDSDGGFALSRYLRLSWTSPATRCEIQTWPDSGYTRIGGRLDGTAMQMVFDHGPLGMAPLYGHAHADALSLSLSIGSKDVLIDPGTFCYTGNQVWREYFRSTSAHNTITVDHNNQAISEGTFMWSSPAQAELIFHEAKTGDAQVFIGRHLGYQRLGVVHYRAVVKASASCLLIWDYLDGEGEHNLGLHWHCGVMASLKNNRFDLVSDDVAISLKIIGGKVSIHSESENPILGWRSPGYGVKVPAWTIRAEYDGPLPHEFLTTIGVVNGQISQRRIEENVTNLRNFVTKNSLSV